MAISPEVATLFLDELAHRNIPVKVGADGGYEIELDGLTATIHLDNLSRDFAHDRDAGRVTRFVDSITRQIRVPDWDAARPRIRWALEPADMPLDDTMHDKVSDQVALVLVHVSETEMEIMWVLSSMAEGWGQTKESLMSVAVENMHTILAETRIDVEPIDEHKLGMVNTELVAFKAALLFCPGLKAIVEPVLGWPVFVVLPCRDFVYLIPQQDQELLGRVGPVVVREYHDSGYPLCTEVFEITDEGARAIGEFQKAPQPEQEPDGDLKTIRYRGGVVCFRIPAHWEEEYQDEGGGTFYDEDSDSGTLRLNTIVAKSQTPVTTRDAQAMAEKRAAVESGTLEELDGGNYLVSYTQTVEEDDDELTIRYWEIVNPVPPDHIRVALFSFTMLSELYDQQDEQTLTDLDLLERELRACQFAPEIGE